MAAGRALAAAWLAAVLASPAGAGQVAVAVATNFVTPLAALTPAFEAATGHVALVSSGSTGKLAAQIAQGAPFDVFLAADAARPEALVAAGHAVAGSASTYALGRLVLLSRAAEATGADCLDFLRASAGKVAIANPRTAPYGAAALQAIDALGLGPALADRLVQGEDIGQTYAFVATGNAVAGFVGLSQVIDQGDDGVGCRWTVPTGLHDPIAQRAVLLVHGRDNPAAAAFLAFLRGPEAAAIIARFGYGAGS